MRGVMIKFICRIFGHNIKCAIAHNPYVKLVETHRLYCVRCGAFKDRIVYGKQAPVEFKEAYGDICGMSVGQVDLILATQDKQCTKYSRVKTCLELWRVRDAEIEQLKEQLKNKTQRGEDE